MTRRTWWTASIGPLVASLALATFASAGPDRDADGVADENDNCLEVSNPDQRDTDRDGYGNICDPDFDNNYVVDFADLSTMAAAFFGPSSVADLNGDGVVNFADLGILRKAFHSPGRRPGPSGAEIHFINPLGGDWSEPLNWDRGTVPGPTDIVRIDLGPDTLVEYYEGDPGGIGTGNPSVLGLLTTSPFAMNGALSVRDANARFDDIFYLSGAIGHEDGMNIVAGDGRIVVAEGALLQDMTLGEDIDIQGYLEAYGYYDPFDLMLDDAVVTLESGGLGNSHDFGVGGHGEIVLNGEHNQIYAEFSVTTGPGITIRTGTGGGWITGFYQSVTLHGDLVSSLAGETIGISANEGSARILGRVLVTANASVEIHAYRGSAEFGGIVTLDPGARVEIHATRGILVSDLSARLGGTTANDVGRVVVLGIPRDDPEYYSYGSAFLEGTLNVVVVNDYVPEPCDRATVFTWFDHSGEFSTFNGPDLGAGATFELQYLAKSLDLVAPPGWECRMNLTLLEDVSVVASSKPDDSHNVIVADSSDWCTTAEDPTRSVELEFPLDVTVDEIAIVSPAGSSNTHYTTGQFELYDDADFQLYASGVVPLVEGGVAVKLESTVGVRKARFTGLAWGAQGSCIDAFQVSGVRR